MEFAVYEYPNLAGTYGVNHFIFEGCRYYPSMVMRDFTFSNLGLSCTEIMGNAVPGALTWYIEMESLSEKYTIDKQLYTVLKSKEKFNVDVKNKDIQLKFQDLEYYISMDETVVFGVFEDEMRLLDSISRGELSSDLTEGNYLVIAHRIKMGTGDRQRICIGLGSRSNDCCRKAISVGEDLQNIIEDRWNRWFNTLPRLPFNDDREKKAYYKSWWVIKTNYYDHPEWGFCITEALPVYKGIWQWAMPSVEWHSGQNTEYTSQWIKKAMDMLIDNQREDGYITHTIYVDEEIPGERWAKGKGIVQTPHLPWVAIRYYHTTKNREPLEKWYRAFERYYEYLCRTRDEEMMNLHLWGITASFDAGLDTTCAFQKVTYGEDGVKEDFCYPAIFASERRRYEEAMAKLAEILNKDGSGWLKEADATKAAMDRYLWDDDKKWYGVLHQDGTLDTRVGVDGLFPLVYHFVDEDRATMMKNNFSSLIGPYGVRTVAEGEPGYREDVYWRGAAWPKTGSLAMEICRHYYPDLMDKVYKSVVNMALVRPSIWECYVAQTGRLARSDHGFICTPCVSSNVGAGDIIGSLMIYHGFDMYGMDESLPLTEMHNFHWQGMRITLEKKNGGWYALFSGEEKESGTVQFIEDQKHYAIYADTTAGLWVKVK